MQIEKTVINDRLYVFPEDFATTYNFAVIHP